MAEALAGLGTRVDLGGAFPKGPELFLYDSARDPASGPQEGRPLMVLIHGLGDEADSFRRVFTDLGAFGRVLAPDLPGFGRSLARKPVTFDYCVASLRALLASLRAEGAAGGKVVLVGSSLGAALAQALAMADPAWYAGLVLVDGGLPSQAPASLSTFLFLLPLVGEGMYRSLRGRPQAAFASLKPYYADLSALPAEEQAFLEARVQARVDSDTQLRAYFSLFRSYAAAVLARSPGFGAFMAQGRLPTLVVWGQADGVLPESGGRALAASCPSARFALIEGGGHLPHQEAPASFLAQLGGFISSLPC